ncbi:hypothetical protein [Amycolatopsis minnesotensis]|uniref:Uncharacterized protein n=1 Tax=Amycolatopsis minnesotensis TaxID=337894 RepID=A0ABN2QYC5_9PSEU
MLFAALAIETAVAVGVAAGLTAWIRRHVASEATTVAPVELAQ